MKRACLIQCVLCIVLILFVQGMFLLPRFLITVKTSLMPDGTTTNVNVCEAALPVLYVSPDMEWDDVRDVLAIALGRKEGGRVILMLTGPATSALAKKFWREVLSIDNVILIQLLLDGHHESPTWIDANMQVMKMFPDSTSFLFVDALRLNTWRKKHIDDVALSLTAFSSCEPLPLVFVHHDPTLQESKSWHPSVLVALLLPGIHIAGPDTRRATMLLLDDKSTQSRLCYQNSKEMLENPAPTTCQITLVMTMDDMLSTQPSSWPWLCNLKHVRRSRDVKHKLHSKPIPTERRDDSLCLALPFRSSNSHRSLTEHVFFQKSLRSIRTTASKHLYMRFYVGFESSDPLLTQSFQRDIFANATLEQLSHGDEVILMELPHAQQDIVYIWNSLFFRAVEDECVWLMHLTDDVDFVNTPGAGMDWDVRFKTRLKSSTKYPFVGSIGRNRTNAPNDVNTMPMVHRTHFEAMGTFYSTRTHNVFSDTSLYLLYRDMHLLAGPQELDRWINLSDEDKNGTRRYADCEPSWEDSGSFPGWRDFNPQKIIDYLRDTRNIADLGNMEGSPWFEGVSDPIRLRDVRYSSVSNFFKGTLLGLTIGLGMSVGFVGVGLILVMMAEGEEWLMDSYNTSVDDEPRSSILHFRSSSSSRAVVLNYDEEDDD